MQDLSEMLNQGCHFCKKPLTVETARHGTMQIKVPNTRLESQPIPIICCADCEVKLGP